MGARLGRTARLEPSLDGVRALTGAHEHALALLQRATRSLASRVAADEAARQEGKLALEVTKLERRKRPTALLEGTVRLEALGMHGLVGARDREELLE